MEGGAGVTGDEAVHVQRVEAIRTRYQRGDGLYGPDAIGTLLKEISILSERCLTPAGFELRGDDLQTVWIYHRCGAGGAVGSLVPAVEWARKHRCAE